ncbi:BNR repeat-containing protein [Flavobacterium subsaxonicum]|uniref:Neuraminidase n=1 Tax=Flavobacterium subsaxonicum WB 4.1-42 = DSM 21790 TaxID=1121898 RepID=A0A0A2MQP4_9FLAO|nr:BNR repeat-containing protein [Flavobacterium subsaxonicum]KGO94634.1 neuraminidase [Flavobacterium subsaxonicum WB 4.1-42 = DSM 21790]
MMQYKQYIVRTLIACLLGVLSSSCVSLKTTQTTVGLGWSSNSVNTVVFRNSALTSLKNYQFTAYYDNDGYMVLGKRKLGSSNWQVVKSEYKGNVKDAHNTISLAVDAKGYVHVSFDHHDTRLRYAKSKEPFGLALGAEQSMTGSQELKVTYPEFHNLPNGKLIFCYRSGASGRGNMVINSYNAATDKWTQLQNNLLNGEELRSAYWQICVDNMGYIHVSWVWRESWDVSTNHDICYTVSKDGGVTWQKSTGEAYVLPITVASAEVAWPVPQNSSLINQTSMTADANGNPYIATYWDNDGIPQYKVVYKTDGKWQLLNTNFHKNTFTLGGGGTKNITISRPKVLINKAILYLLFRDAERGSKITLTYADLDKKQWQVKNLTEQSVGDWEPNYDQELWSAKKQLHIFSQKVTQVDGEGLQQVAPQPVNVIEVKNLP